MFMMDSNLPLTEKWPTSCHLLRTIAQSTAFDRYMGWTWFTMLWMIVDCSWLCLSIMLAICNLSLSCITPHMLHIFVPTKHLQHCSNMSGGQVCNEMYVSILLDVQFVKGLTMSTKHLQSCCNHYQYHQTSSSIGL